MQFRDDDRAQSIQVGAILLFGILIITLATFQATVVPDQNAGIEFDHSQTVQSDMQDLRNGVLRAADGDASPTRVSLGTTYSNRLLFINPPPPTGELRTVGADDPAVNVTIGNESGSVTVDSEYENAREYWATAPDAGMYNTSEIVYTPDYAEYDGAPTTVYENSVLYNTFDNGANRTLSGQRVVQGNTVNLLALRGDLDATGAGSHTADVTTVSEQARTVTVESEPDDPLYVNVTSRLSAEVWNENLLGSNAAASDDGTVTIDGKSYRRISIELDSGSYRLRGSAVGVGALTDNESMTDPAYMVVTDGYEAVGNGSEGNLTVEVRDRFNNPVTGEEVKADADDYHIRILNGPTVETDAEGKATIRYRGGNITGDGESGWLNVSLENPEGSYGYKNRTGLDVPEFAFGDSSGGGDDLNLGERGDIILRNSVFTSNSRAVLSFENVGEENVTLVGARAGFFYPGQNERATEITFRNPTSTVLLETTFGGPYGEISPSREVGINEQIDLTVDIAGEGSDYVTFRRSLFSITLVFEVNGVEQRFQYIVSPQEG